MLCYAGIDNSLKCIIRKKKLEMCHPQDADAPTFSTFVTKYLDGERKDG